MEKSNMNEAIDSLKKGELLIYPSDTSWAIGCDAGNDGAVEKLIKLKGSDEQNGYICLVDSDTKLNRFVKQVPDIAWDIVELSEKPTTIIYPDGYNLSQKAMGKDKSIAIRIVKDGFCHQLLRKFGKPLISTSANLSGGKLPKSFSDIDQRILNGVDYIVNLPKGEKLSSKPSTIMKIGLDSTFTLIRK